MLRIPLLRVIVLDMLRVVWYDAWFATELPRITRRYCQHAPFHVIRYVYDVSLMANTDCLVCLLWLLLGLCIDSVPLVVG